MPYKYNVFIVFASVIVFSFSCNCSKHSEKSKTLPGTWQSQPIVIDGDSKDWPSPYPNYDAKAMVAYATSNDKNNLYVTMETGDEMTQLKILKQGMTVSIDTNGRKESQFNINYPLQNDNDPIEMSKQEPHKKESHYHPEGQWSSNIRKSAKDANQFSLEGFKNCNGGYIITQTTSCGIKVMLRIDEYKELVWEAVIPFRAIYNKDTITAADAGRPISVCFSVNRFKHPGSKSSSDNSANPAGMNNNMSSGGMRGGGASRGGGRSPNEDPLQHLYENTKTWKQFGIAYQH